MTLSTKACAPSVDDDALIFMNVGEILADAGFRPLATATPDAAIAVLEKPSDQIISLVTDVEMNDHLRAELPDGKKLEPLKQIVYFSGCIED